MKHILIVRLSAIGDIVMASPVAWSLKRQYPEARISWLVQPECAALLHDNPLVDEVILWPRREWQEHWRSKNLAALFKAVTALKQELRSRGFDMALDLQGLLKSGFLTWLSGAKRRVGLGSREGSQYLMHRTVPRDRGDTEMIGSEYRWLCRELGLAFEPFPMQVGMSAESQRNAADLVKQIGRPFAVICPFTTRPQKHWFNHHWQALVPQLRARDLEVVMLGGPGDREAAASLETGLELVNLVGKTSLQEAAALIGQSQCLVGVDTGLTHMGHAFGIPTVALFGSTRPYLKTDSRNSRVIYHDLPCAPCKRNPTCGGTFDCLRDITPEEVLTHLQPMLASDP